MKYGILATLLVATFLVLIAHAAYLAVGVLTLGHGSEDPIYQVTGIPRRLQLELTAWPFLLMATFATVRAFLIRFYSFDFSGKRLGIAVVFVLLFLNLLASSTEVFVTELHVGFWPDIGFHLAIVLLVELLIVGLVTRFVANPRASGIILAAMITANAFALFLLLFDTYLSLSLLTHVGVAIVVFAGSLMVVLYCAQRDTAWRPVAMILVVTAVAPAVNAATSTRDHSDPEALMRYDAIRFAEKLDVHIISFESLIPPSLAASLLGIDDIAYADVLKRPSVSAFQNAFASYVPTGRSLNSLMTLSDPAFTPWERWIYFQGQADSPLSRIFRNNGYRVLSGASFGSFGISGEYVDDYHPRADAAFTASGLCRLANKHPFALFWICQVSAALAPPGASMPWPEKLLGLLAEKSVDASSRLTFHHVVITFHTQLGFDANDPSAVQAFAREFEGLASDVRAYMDQLIEIVESNGRPAILFGFGDHGTYVSAEDGFSNNPEFFVQDRHGISAAVYHNNTTCEDSMIEHYRAQKHTTPERLVAGIIRCLADDPSDVDSAVDFLTQYYFSDFVYE